MIISFKQLKFKNILSFGAKETVIDFTKGINLISGKNGSGKSAILDALSFCLFGKPYRNIKIKELINRRNKRNTEVTCEFTIDNRSSYVIKRTLEPYSLEIVKDGNEEDLLSSKRLNQEELDKIIGINYYLFKQVISLAVNYNKPFLSLSSMEKRQIIEQIFNITVFGQMLKEAKRKNADTFVRYEMSLNSIKILEENLKTLRKNLKEITTATKDFEKNKQTEIQSIEKRIQKYHEDIYAIKTDIDRVEKELISFSLLNMEETITENKLKLSEITKITNTTEYTIENNHNTIHNLENDVVCPRCKTILTKEHKQKEIEKLNNELKNLKKELETKESERKEYVEHLEYLESLKVNYNKYQGEKKNLEEKKKMLESELKHLNENLNKVSNRKIDIDVDSITNDFHKKIEEYKIVFKDSQNLKNIIENYELVYNILSESGIKAFFFRKLVPILNSKINEYLQLFEIPIVLSFNELMEEKITNYENMKSDISYCSYSEGEKKRIDMSILLSFISITKTISNWNCNLLLIDELLDSAIDESGLDKLVTSLKNMTYESNLSVYIISHRLQQDYSSKFNNCLQVEKVDSFSKIEYI